MLLVLSRQKRFVFIDDNFLRIDQVLELVSDIPHAIALEDLLLRGIHLWSEQHYIVTLVSMQHFVTWAAFLFQDQRILSRVILILMTFLLGRLSVRSESIGI